jgi:hypothetical protein
MIHELFQKFRYPRKNKPETHSHKPDFIISFVDSTLLDKAKLSNSAWSTSLVKGNSSQNRHLSVSSNGAR